MDGCHRTAGLVVDQVVVATVVEDILEQVRMDRFAAVVVAEVEIEAAAAFADHLHEVIIVV